MRRIKKHIKHHVGWHYLEDPRHLFFVVLIILGGIFGARYSLWAYPKIFETQVFSGRAKDLDPRDPFVVHFSQPVFPDDYADKTKISPERNFRLRWKNSNKDLEITPVDFWEPETQYRVMLPESTSRMFTGVPETQINFSTINYPRVEKFFPKDGAKEVVLDIEDPITVTFDKPTYGFFVNFALEPETGVTYENNPEKTQFKLLPREKLKEGETYKVSVHMEYKGGADNTSKLVHTSSFETLPSAPEIWEKDFTLRLEQAKKYIRPKILTGKYIDVNLSTQIMSLFENGGILDTYLISSGKRGMDTPKGQHAISNKTPRAWSKTYGLYMPYWMAIVPSGKFGIHELPEWPGGYKEGANHLGIPVSHGCMRLGVGPAERVYGWADIGTPVVVY